MSLADQLKAIAAVELALSAVAGLRPAEPGEFTRRALTNGRIDLTYTGAAWSGPAAFEEAKLTPKDIQYASIYDSFTITLAVAGFTDDDLSISLENSQLTIAGRQPDPDQDRVFLHRGIASRAFQRSFVLADGVEVDGARLENGLLTIALRRRQQQSVVQTIPISRT